MLNLYKNLPNGVVQFPGHPRAYLVDGFILPLVPDPDEEKLKTPQRLKYHETDVLVCTYPKSGTYWTNFICAQLLGKADFISDSGEESRTLSRLVPQMDVWPVEYFENLPQPRIIYSHLPMCYMAVNEKPKYIVVMRNPKDVLVSFYFHIRSMEPIYNYADGKLDEFFEVFMNGCLSYGSYFDKLLDSLKYYGKPNFLFIKYEEMVYNLKEQVIKIGKFLGGKAAEVVSDETKLNGILNQSLFSEMFKHQERWIPKRLLRDNFFRKGKVGDWRNYLTREQSYRIDEEFKKRMAGTIAENWWQEEMRWYELEIGKSQK